MSKKSKKWQELAEKISKLPIKYKKSEIDTFTEERMAEILAGAEAANSIMDTVETPEKIELAEGPVAIPAPTSGDPEWTDYVLGLLTKDEKDQNGNPKTDGLRRVATKLYGDFDIFSDVIQCPDVENAYRATVSVRLYFHSTNGITVCGSADVYSGNTEHEYAKHAVATAETRAEGRALRRALKLVKVLAAEELNNADKDEPDGSDKRVVGGMLNAIRIMCDRMKVDPFTLSVKLGFNINSIEELTQVQAKQITTTLGKYQRQEEEIPDAVRIK